MNEFLMSVETAHSQVNLIDLKAGCRPFDTRLETLPYSLRVLLENALRRGDSQSAQRIAKRHSGESISFLPARLLLQDLLGVPVLIDLSSMRDAASAVGADPAAINPQLPVDFVIDHSLIPVHYGSNDARSRNEALELSINHERFRFLRWCQSSFTKLRVIPPGKGIMHQINIEYLARGYQFDEDKKLAFPDSVYGTDSHTPMVNGVGVVGWGVGGLEAEMAMLGRETTFPLPEVVGIRLIGNKKPGVTATDLVLTITELLRQHGVVGKFVEFTGDSLDQLPVADRCTIANMAPEYGATCVYFPFDQRTLDYLSLSGREPEQVRLIEQCAQAQGLWREPSAPEYDTLLELELDSIVPSIAGPKRPEDRIPLQQAHQNLADVFDIAADRKRHKVASEDFDMGDGDIVIAAITSCTNTSNPAVVIGAALLARNALERGLTVKPWVKTTFAPGSQVVAAYLREAGLQKYLDALGFNIVGFGCTTCNGGSGPLAEPIRDTIEAYDLTCAAVLSGNRNFAGRINPYCRANYIMSPPLVVAYAIAGTMQADIFSGSLGTDSEGKDVYLQDIWPNDEEIEQVMRSAIGAELFQSSYASLLQGGAGWDALDSSGGSSYDWNPESTYLKRVPYFDNAGEGPTEPGNLHALRPLVILGDSITTDHISPSGTILADSAAGQYLLERGIDAASFNTYGTRRGNHDVAMRSAFANNRLRNEMTPDSEGSLTRLMPEGTEMRVFEAAIEYQSRGVGLIVIAGKEYGCGSSRDTAAKSINLLGVRAVVAESYERIHRSNLVGMGILPLQFENGVTRKTLNLTGAETFDILGIDNGLEQSCQLTLVVHYADGRTAETAVLARLDTPIEVDFIKHGGVLPHAFRTMVSNETAASRNH